jgi:hypothetical protein
MSGVALAILITSVSGPAGPDASVPFPADYRKWVVVKSFLIGPQSVHFERSGGMHHYYLNEKALDGYGKGKFEDGAILVDERLQTSEHDGAIFEGQRITAAVMIKDSTRYRDTGAWGFERFTEGDPPSGAAPEVRAACFECHSKRKDHDFVFSEPKK